jgi:MFS family permease
VDRPASTAILTPPFMALTGAHFLSSLGYASMAILPLYLDHLDADRAQIGAIMAISSVGGLLSRPAVGLLLDRVGRRITLVLGIGILSIALFLLGTVVRIDAWVFIVRLMIGVGIGAAFTAYFTVVADLVPISRRTEGIALFGISGLVPLAINPFVGQLGIAPGNLRWLFPILGAVVLLSGVLALQVRDVPQAVVRAKVGMGDMLRALRSEALLPVWLATTLFAMMFATFFAFVSVTAAGRNVSDPTAMWLTYAAGAALIRLFGARLPDRIGPSRLVIPALLCYVAALVLAASAQSWLAFVVAGALAGLGHGTCFPLLASQTATRAPDHLRGSALATFTALWDIAALLVVPGFGLLARATSDGTMLLSASAIAGVGLVGWAVLERRALGRMASAVEG